MPDLKQKLKLVAIEEEITKLQLQICRESNMYLGAKSEDTKEEEANKFIAEVIEPSVDGAFQFKKLPYAEVKLLFTPAAASATPTPTKKAGSWTDTIKNTASTLKKGVEAIGDAAVAVGKVTNTTTFYQIQKAAQTEHNGHVVLILIAFDNTKDNTLGIHITTQDTLKTTKESSLTFTPMWTDPAKFEDFESLKQRFFNDYFSLFIQQLPVKIVRSVSEIKQEEDAKAAQAAAQAEINAQKQAEAAAKRTADLQLKRDAAAAKAEQTAAELEAKKEAAASELAVKKEAAAAKLEAQKEQAAIDLELKRRTEELNRLRQQQNSAANSAAQIAKFDQEIAALEAAKRKEEAEAAKATSVPTASGRGRSATQQVITTPAKPTPTSATKPAPAAPATATPAKAATATPAPAKAAVAPAPAKAATATPAPAKAAVASAPAKAATATPAHSNPISPPRLGHSPPLPSPPLRPSHRPSPAHPPSPPRPRPLPPRPTPAPAKAAVAPAPAKAASNRTSTSKSPSKRRN